MAKKAGIPINQLDFQKHIVQIYLLRYRNTPRTGGRPQASRQSQTVTNVTTVSAITWFQ